MRDRRLSVQRVAGGRSSRAPSRSAPPPASPGVDESVGFSSRTRLRRRRECATQEIDDAGRTAHFRQPEAAVREDVSMRAVTFTEYGGPEVLSVAEADEPHAGPRQVRIAVRAAGVNPIDWKARSGVMREVMPLEFPMIDGREAAGVVDQVGEGVDGVSPGDEVFGFSVAGAAAEYAVLDDFARKPAGLSWEEAAARPVAAETSVRVFNLLGGPGEGQTIVINGAAGGVGTAAVQFARARGARVIAT